LYRFRAAQIAEDSYSNQLNTTISEDGGLTAVVLAAMKQADDDAFEKIQSGMRRLIPAIERVFTKPAQLLHPSNPNPVIGSKLYFDFRGTKSIPADHASQGTLIVLSLLTVLHGPRQPRLILLDDFDHALHPRAQMELVRMIKELLALEEFHDTQIVATTHSPYVLDEVSPDEIVAFALRDDGTVAAKPLSDHPDAPKYRSP
jgi:predicted ATPase